MHDKICTIREFKTRNFTVTVNAVYDGDLDLSWDDTGEIEKGLSDGTYVAFGVVATVTHKSLGIVGRDSLWNCIYKDPIEFMDHKQCGRENHRLASEGNNARCGSYFADMIGRSIDEARKNIRAAQSIYVRV